MSDSGRLSTDAFTDAFAAAGRTLWCVAVGVLGRSEGAEDVLQEAAITALGKLGDFHPGSSFVAWMSQIVRYTALNHARRRQRAPLVAVEPEAMAAFAGTDDPAAGRTPVRPDGGIARDQAAFDDAVVEALATLEDVPRSCLLLRVVMDLPYREIARVLDIPEGTAMSHVHRSRRSLRSLLGDTSATTSPTDATVGHPNPNAREGSRVSP